MTVKTVATGMALIATNAGHLEVLKWLHENGYPWNEDTCELAARHGHLGVLQWAHANGCPWDEGTCAAAARGGHTEALAWARKKDCPWDEEMCLLFLGMGVKALDEEDAKEAREDDTHVGWDERLKRYK